MASLIIEGIGVGYPGKPVLTDVTLPEIPPGSLVGVLGPNGVGKSTLLRALAGLGPFTGRAHLNGEALDRMTHFRRAQRVGYLPQTLPQETSLVAYEAVLSACRAVRPDMPVPDVDRAVERVFDVLDIRDLAFQALNKMSGGQRQMVGLAQVIVRRPAVLLLDEPTSALDLRWQITVLETVRMILSRHGGQCLMALHDINLAIRHCDYIALFGDGKLLAFGPPAEAMTADALTQAYGVAGRVETCSRGLPFVVTEPTSSPLPPTGR
ncbi:MAG: ABC transporter ATP-binding protein [Rhodospirillales bacterium]